jgi:hypothetical protein
MNTEFQEDNLEPEPFLEKSLKRKDRRNQSAKARQKREYRNSKLEREYEDGFGGNFN